MRHIVTAIVLLTLAASSVWAQWKQIQAPEVGQQSVFGLASNDSYIFVGAADSNIVRSSDNGLTWQRLSPGLSVHRKNYVLLEHKGRLFVAARSGLISVFQSTDNGQNWDSISQGDLDPILVAKRFYVDENDSIYIVGRDGVAVLRGNKWATLLLSTQEVFFANDLVSRNNVLYLAGLYVYRSNDRGATWDTLSRQIKYNPQGIYVTDHSIIVGMGPGIFRTLDSGQNWLRSTDSSLKATNINFFYPVGSVLFAGTAYGLYRSTDEAGSWTAVNDGLPKDTIVRAYSMIVHDGMVFIGTEGRGLWKRPLSELLPPADVAVTGKSIASVHLSQSYPNPAVEDITIEYALPHEESISLKLYDSYLNEITTLAQGREEAGAHRVTANVRSLASGVYFYRLTVGSATITQRMLVTR